jgi:hypothetical protein
VSRPRVYTAPVRLPPCLLESELLDAAWAAAMARGLTYTAWMQEAIAAAVARDSRAGRRAAGERDKEKT